MAFFRKWKTHYKHKKFTSDDVVDESDYNSKKQSNQPNIENMKLDIDCLSSDDELNDDPIFESYDIKYLGCTPIDAKRSEKLTSEAIKTVIANSKAGGRKNKTQKRVKLNISEDGLEVLDFQTQETLLRFSIYKIFYCTVDAAHDHTFSFVSSEKDTLTEQEKLSCHVFYCRKRKVAHEITLMVARCFEHAYQHWRDAVIQNQKSNSVDLTDNAIRKQVLKEQNVNGKIESRAEVHQHNNDELKTDHLLIDLAAPDNDMRKYLQNTWVSFDDDGRDGGQLVAC
ncbi:uncharacterized protein LOC119689588 [Teleopsis dalmanni]|uniref:uncharacterized protein LOC119689588 n=1 Tax=Teleopsis dalmanni TaxID=139649 RepID=UPI0018CE2CC8|nr:uncharacterized protein LOC119689588 [Teleopsis dalmanni]